jgi:hypothetical protein
MIEEQTTVRDLKKQICENEGVISTSRAARSSPDEVELDALPWFVCIVVSCWSEFRFENCSGSHEDSVEQFRQSTGIGECNQVRGRIRDFEGCTAQALSDAAEV